MNFPKKESDVYQLAANMLNGVTLHPADFPGVDPLVLSDAITGYTVKKNSAEDAKSGSMVATATKQVSLEDLVAKMKTALKQAEVDCAANPEKLTEIGWAPKAAPTPISVPFAPTDLQSFYEGPGSLTLKWKKPAHDSSRPVVNYIIQRRQQSDETTFTDWQLADSCLTNQSLLIGQTRGVQLEYRVFATNAAGNSIYSNTVPVVL